MDGDGDSRPPRRGIGAADKAAFLAALRRGARRDDAAAGTGFSLTGFYGARRRDPAFAAAWAAALAAPPAAGRRTRAYEARDARLAREAAAARPRGEVRIAAANRRVLQRRRRRHVRFDAERQAAFLAHFAANGDTRAAAAAAGVSHSTVHLHAGTDPEFAEAYRAALAEAYRTLEAEIVRERLAAQRRLRAAVESAWGGEGMAARSPSAACPLCGLRSDSGAEFDRVMKLLARFDRKPRRRERGFSPGGRRQAWTFDRAIALLDRKLRALGARTTPPVPEEGKDPARPSCAGRREPALRPPARKQDR